MFDPKPGSEQSGPRTDETGPNFWHSEELAGRAEECELCESETVTSTRYGMDVCRTCEERYLP